MAPKKKFIDKKKATTYSLLASDAPPATGHDGAGGAAPPQHVLHPVKRGDKWLDGDEDVGPDPFGQHDDVDDYGDDNDDDDGGGGEPDAHDPEAAGFDAWLRANIHPDEKARHMAEKAERRRGLGVGRPDRLPRFLADFDSEFDGGGPDEARRREMVALGLPDDGYDYMQHLRSVRVAVEDAADGSLGAAGALDDERIVVGEKPRAPMPGATAGAMAAGAGAGSIFVPAAGVHARVGDLLHSVADSGIVDARHLAPLSTTHDDSEADARLAQVSAFARARRDDDASLPGGNAAARGTRVTGFHKSNKRAKQEEREIAELEEAAARLMDDDDASVTGGSEFGDDLVALLAGGGKAEKEGKGDEECSDDDSDDASSSSLGASGASSSEEPSDRSSDDEDGARADTTRRFPLPPGSVASSAWAKAPRTDRPELLEAVDERFEARKRRRASGAAWATMVMKDYLEEQMGDFESDDEGREAARGAVESEHLEGALAEFEREARNTGARGAATMGEAGARGGERRQFTAASDWFAAQEAREREAAAARSGAGPAPAAAAAASVAPATLELAPGEVEGLSNGAILTGAAALVAANREADAAKEEADAAASVAVTARLATEWERREALAPVETDRDIAKSLRAPGSYLRPRPRAKWDCESVLSLRSNVENHPGTVAAPPRRAGPARADGASATATAASPAMAPIVLSGRTGLPLRQAYLDGNGDKTGDNGASVSGSGRDGDDRDGADLLPANRGAKRDVGETPEEKKARKAAVREERAAARARKKGTTAEYKEVAKSEKKRLAAPGHGVSVLKLA